MIDGSDMTIHRYVRLLGSLRWIQVLNRKAIKISTKNENKNLH